jgi:antitoxin component YwqK of YwqJK toxin-antitoxin module
MAEERFKDGTLSGDGDYADGQRNGPWTFYFRNGRVKAKGPR